ncbi:MAG: isocitrate lyase/phosphoenolpyruvate mutase family protein [Geminicoccaceae bacterium]
MADQATRAKAFHALHVKGNPLILFNIWDAGSAIAVAKAGAPALATGSWSVAAAQGYADGENLPLDFLTRIVERIVATSDLPVSVDLEGGYGRTGEQVASAVTKVLEAGAIGFNFEDQIVGGDGIYCAEEQAARIGAARKAAERTGCPAFINARTDLFLKAKPEDHDQAMLDDALDRARAYEQAGASGFFAPALIDESLIERLCETSPLPVNIMALRGAPGAERLAELGVARISHGPGPYRQMVRWLEEEAGKVY